MPAARQARISAETVLADTRVIAIDQPADQGATPARPNHRRATTVTLEVTPGHAERVEVATRLGHLSLAVVAVAPTTNRTAASGGHDASPTAPTTRQWITWAERCVRPRLRGILQRRRCRTSCMSTVGPPIARRTISDEASATCICSSLIGMAHQAALAAAVP